VTLCVRPLDRRRLRGTVRILGRAAMTATRINSRSPVLSFALVAVQPAAARAGLKLNFGLSAAPRLRFCRCVAIPACSARSARNSPRRRASSGIRTWKSAASRRCASRPTGRGPADDPAPFCSGVARVSDGTRHVVHYSIAEPRAGSALLGRRVVHGRARPQLGLQSVLPDARP